ncbi:MAG: hypothetical protein ACRDD7_04810 [Peptostreptococcaceae bacterium]
MEKEILEIFKEIKNDIKKMDNRLSNLEEGQTRIEKKLDGVVDQTANLTEFRTTVISKLDDLKEVEEVTKINCYDIAKLKSIK